MKQNTKYYICAVLINHFISKIGEEHETLNQHRVWQHTILAMLLHAGASKQRRTMTGNKIIVLAAIL
jgi:hypothetical protein